MPKKIGGGGGGGGSLSTFSALDINYNPVVQ